MSNQDGVNYYSKMSKQAADHYSFMIDENGYVTKGKFDTVATPDTTTLVFQKGCEMTKTDAGNGVAAIYQNTGTLAAPAWTLMDVAGAGGITQLTGAVTAGPGNGSVVASIASDAVTTVKILNANVTLAKLASGITPSHVVKFAGTSSAFGGGGTSFPITITGALSTDVATAVIRASTNVVSISKAVLTADTLTITFSADPGAATTIDYSVLRAAA